MKRIIYTTFALLMAVAAIGCGGRTPKSETKAAAPRVFVPAIVPSAITSPEARRVYMCEHYWDKVNLADSTFFAEIDTMQMVQAFMAWVGNYMDPNDGTYVEKFMAKAAKHSHSLRYFSMLAEKVLYEPNSPLRSDELYIPVLQAQVSSEWLDKYEYLIELGKSLKDYPESAKTDDKLIKGCQSRVWLDYKIEDGKVVFNADSDAIITKGIISLLIGIYSGRTPQEIMSSDFSVVEKIGLKENLSPTRANGLVSMIEKIREIAVRNA